MRWLHGVFALGLALGVALPPTGALAEAPGPAPLSAPPPARQADEPAPAPLPETRPAWLDAPRRGDRVVLVKSARRLHVFRGPLLLRSYRVALGFEPEGPKRVQGDGRTPEGRYTLDWRSLESRYHRAFHVSYPNARDRARARSLGRPPGGDIMVHGLPKGLGDIGPDHTTADWTNGCIALTNEQMDDLWTLIDDGTPIDILP